jgi:hypothetical protein
MEEEARPTINLDPPKPADTSDGPDALDALDAAATDAATAGRRIRVRTVVLAVLALAAVVLAVLVGPTAWAVFREKDARLEPPAEVAGLTLDRSDNAQETVDYLRDALSTQVSLDATVGAAYGQAGEPTRGVVVVGGTGLLLSPGTKLAKVFELVTDQTGSVDAIHDVPAGPLGGVVRCGATETDDGPMAVCGWADHGSLAIGLFANRSADESARLLRDLRQAMQHRD